MPGSKEKGNGKGSKKKESAARRVYQTRNTSGKPEPWIEETQLDTVATESSPVGLQPSLKKQLPVSKSATSPKKQASPPNSPGRESGIVASIVTVIKKKEPSKEEES